MESLNSMSSRRDRSLKGVVDTEIKPLLDLINAKVSRRKMYWLMKNNKHLMTQKYAVSCCSAFKYQVSVYPL